MFRLFIETDFESFLSLDKVPIVQVRLPQMYVPRKTLNHEQKIQRVDANDPGKHIGMDEELWTYW